MRRLILVLLTLAVLGVGYLTFRLFSDPVSPLLGSDSVNWHPTSTSLEGFKSFTQLVLPLDSQLLATHDTLAITLNLQGLCLLPAKASEVSFHTSSDSVYSLSLKDYLSNCGHENQAILIPLSDFFPTDRPADLTALSFRFWYPTHYRLEIHSVATYNRVLGVASTKGKPDHSPRPAPNGNKPSHPPKPDRSPRLSPTPTPTPTPSPSGWEFRSVSSMKESKDRICDQHDTAFIDRWVTSARELGATHISLETPYDSPSCGDSPLYTERWLTAIRAQGLGVWHRHMPLAFEGIYDTPKDNSRDYLSQIDTYIRAHPDYFREGDIFTPIPEPQNGGISGVTYCPFNICIFGSKEDFNLWLREAMSVSQAAFNSLGLNGQIRLGYWGFDGFVAWGHNNPDWTGILEDETVQAMGNITIDHYPELVGTTMAEDLGELEARYPGIPLIIGEWGTITGGDIEAQVLDTMSASKRPSVFGFGYWHLGAGGHEALILEDFSPRPQYDEVQSFFKP